MPNKQLIRFYQELSTNAWPAKYYYLLNGWVARISEGITKRANSIMPLTYYGDKLRKDIQVAEAIYTKNELPVIFQLPDYYEPKNLLETLLEKGYKIIDETLVLTANIKDMLDIPINQDFTYQNTAEAKNEWFNSMSVSGRGTQKRIEGQKAIINRILQPKSFFFAKREKEIVGIGMAVLEQGNLGIFDMLINPAVRRQGIAGSLIAKMVDWGKENSIQSTYLCVQGDNQPAIALYKRVGLRESFRYRYLIKK
ncbi:MAG: GNAT family N-acetyltransferase [Candidatus Heimdallarchaeota archaeon]